MAMEKNIAFTVISTIVMYRAVGTDNLLCFIKVIIYLQFSIVDIHNYVSLCTSVSIMQVEITNTPITDISCTIVYILWFSFILVSIFMVMCDNEYKNKRK